MSIVEPKKILITVGYYLPGFKGGGPVRSIANLVAQLGDEFCFFIVTSDRDLGDTFPYSSIRYNEWNIIGRVSIYYLRPGLYSYFDFFNLIRSARWDVIYLNSFFNIKFTIFPLMLRYFRLFSSSLCIVAPRGEFSVGAIQIKKWKKNPYIFFTKIIRFYRDIVWHASTKYELNDINRVMGVHSVNVRIAHIACDVLSEVKSDSSHILVDKYHADSSLVVNICFLSRISEMKNLDFAISTLMNVSVPVNFCIFGPKESLSYWSSCELLLGQLPSNISWSYCGVVPNENVKSVISKFDLFFVPSKGENFGHVFHEAFSAGVPVLVSDRTPWRDLMNKNIGWEHSLDSMDMFVDAIESFSRLDYRQKNEMSLSCLRFAREMAGNEEVLEMNRSLFLY